MPPEKVVGLEQLKAIDLRTPEHLAFLSAEVLTDPDRTAALQILRDFLKREPGKELLVRSAHEQEDELGGGALQSLEVQQNPEARPEVLLATIEKCRGKMIAAADPDSSLQVKRAISLDGVKFNPNAMGVLLNNRIPGPQVTVVPLDNGDLSLRYLERWRFPRELTIHKGTPTTPPEGFLARPKTLQLLITSAIRTQTELGPRELEVIIDETSEEPVFVQARTVPPEKTHDDPRATQVDFDRGVSTSISVVSGPYEEVSFKHDLLRGRTANPRAQRRDTKVLIIDELGWCYNAGIVQKHRHYGDVMSKREWEQYVPFCIGSVNYKRPPEEEIFNEEEEAADAQRHENLARVLESNYTILNDLAATTRDYSLWLKSVPFATSRPRTPISAKIAHLREALIDCASVVIQPYYNRDVGASHHFICSAIGPQQIQVIYEARKPSGIILPHWVERTPKNREAQGKNTLMEGIQTGDDLSIIIRETAVSLLPTSATTPPHL